MTPVTYSMKDPQKEACMEKRIGNIVFIVTLASAIYITYLTV